MLTYMNTHADIHEHAYKPEHALPYRYILEPKKALSHRPNAADFHIALPAILRFHAHIHSMRPTHDQHTFTTYASKFVLDTHTTHTHTHTH
jgi:hypothetical protein